MLDLPSSSNSENISASQNFEFHETNRKEKRLSPSKGPSPNLRKRHKTNCDYAAKKFPEVIDEKNSVEIEEIQCDEEVINEKNSIQIDEIDWDDEIQVIDVSEISHTHESFQTVPLTNNSPTKNAYEQLPDVDGK